MSGRHDAVLDDVLKGLDQDRPATAKKAEGKGPDTFLKRSNKLANLVSGKVVEKTHRWVDPDCCRMWERHNRRYESLNEESCADLIEGFKAQGRQEFPAIVRRLSEDPDYEFEVVCGARRHWTVSWLRGHSYPDFEFLVEERDLSDEEAFRLSDIENRDRLDISDYERALDYLQALELYYDGRQRHMAGRLEVSEDWLSRYLDLGRLPEAVVRAYLDVNQIKTKHARVLKPLLSDRAACGRLLKAAEEIAVAQRDAQQEGRPIRDGQQVLQSLRAAAEAKSSKPAKQRGTLASYKSNTGSEMMTVSRQGRSGLVIRLLPNSGASKKELLDAYKRILSQFVE